MDAATAQARLGRAAKSFLPGKHQLLIDGKGYEAIELCAEVKAVAAAL